MVHLFKCGAYALCFLGFANSVNATLSREWQPEEMAFEVAREWQPGERGGYIFFDSHREFSYDDLPQQKLTMVRLPLFPGEANVSDWVDWSMGKSDKLKMACAFSEPMLELAPKVYLGFRVVDYALEKAGSGDFAAKDWPDNVLASWNEIRVGFHKKYAHLFNPNYLAIEAGDYERIKNEARAAEGSVFKIHMQVKPAYLKSFVEDLSMYVSKDPRLKNVMTMKFAKNPFDVQIIERSMPIVVIYVNKFNGSAQQRDQIIRPIIDALRERYDKHIETIALKDLAPRHNRKINDLIYIAGGNGDVKDEYIKLIRLGYIPRNTMYTEDFAFVRGYELNF